MYGRTRTTRFCGQRWRADRTSLNAQLRYDGICKFVELCTIIESTYAGNAEIAAALRVHLAGLEQRLARLFPSFSVLSRGCDSEGGKGQSEENGGFEELHCCK
jgi:hypothetical protein